MNALGYQVNVYVGVERVRRTRTAELVVVAVCGGGGAQVTGRQNAQACSRCGTYNCAVGQVCAGNGAVKGGGTQYRTNHKKREPENAQVVAQRKRVRSMCTESKREWHAW